MATTRGGNGKGTDSPKGTHHEDLLRKTANGDKGGGSYLKDDSIQGPEFYKPKITGVVGGSVKGKD